MLKKNIIGVMPAQHSLSSCFFKTFAPPKQAVMGCVATGLSHTPLCWWSWYFSTRWNFKFKGIQKIIYHNASSKIINSPFGEKS